MRIRIDVLCSDGSPLGVTLSDLWGNGYRGIGVGGSEYALLTMCEAWHNAGYEVVLYNNPTSVNTLDQRPISAFDPNENRDVLITFRTPNPKAIIAKGLKVWWSCDQYTSQPFQSFAPHMQKIVVISEFHKKYFKETYGIENTTIIDLPVRLEDFSEYDIPKISKRCIFTSIPDRGLEDLYRIWSNTISKRVPEATLTITSDYRLWGVDERNAPHRVRWMYEPNISFLGAIKREELIKEQLSADLLVYPSTYDELFCVSVAEAQACGVYPITTDTGALPTTNMGKIVPRSSVNFHATFAHTVVELLNNSELPKLQEEVKQKAIERFSIQRIIREWENKIFL